MEIYPNVAITFFNSKEASLYFDNIIPFGSNTEWLVDRLIKHRDEGFCPPPEDILLPETLRKSRQFSLDFYKITHMHTSYEMKHHLRHVDKVTLRKELQQDAVFLHKEVQKIIRKYNLEKIPIISSKKYINDNHDKNCDSFSIIASLPALNLIDVENVSWSNIEEFRKDQDSKSKLRRLKLFAYENYKDKPISFIEDDILQKISDYNDVVSKWGFETKFQVLSMVFSSKVLAGAISGCLISNLLGADMQSIFTAIGGVSVELGRIGIFLRKRKYEITNIIESNPISFVSSANKLFKNI